MAAKNDEFYLFQQFDRIAHAIRDAKDADHLVEGLVQLIITIKGVVKSFGVEEIRVRQSTIQRPGDKAGSAAFIYEQIDRTGKVVKSYIEYRSDIALPQTREPVA